MKTLLIPTLGLLAMAVPGYAQQADYCREFTTTVTIGGIRQPAWGTSCLQPDGSWQVVSAAPQQTVAYNEDLLPYDEDDFVVVQEQRPVFNRIRHSRRYDHYPQTSLSFGKSWLTYY